MTKNIKINEEDLKKLWNEHKEDYKTKKYMKFQLIFCQLAMRKLTTKN